MIQVGTYGTNQKKGSSLLLTLSLTFHTTIIWQDHKELNIRMPGIIFWIAGDAVILFFRVTVIIWSLSIFCNILRKCGIYAYLPIAWCPIII